MKKMWLILVVVLQILVVICCFLVFYPVKYQKIVTKYCEMYNLEPALIYAMINTESRFDRRAVSNVGACGLMQIMPTTSEEIAEKLGEDDFDIFDVETNIQFGCYYIRYLIDRYNDIVLGLSAYNAGPSNVDNWIKSGFSGKKEDIPVKQTRNYVKKVLRSRKIYKSILSL